MNPPMQPSRLDYLDAVRAFALLLGIVFHASLSFMPIFIGWAVMDISTSSIIPAFALISHAFRMELFFLIAGFFAHMSFHRKGVAAFLKSRFLRIALPFGVAWFVLRPLIVSGWIMGGQSLQGEVDIAAGLMLGFQSLQSLPADLFTGTHLWFLYYLMVVTISTLLVARILALMPRFEKSLCSAADRSLRWLAGSSSAAPILAIPTAACLLFMSGWGMDTPDKSLVPHLPTFLVYFGCFALGWMLHRQPSLLDAISRLTPSRLVTIIGAPVLTLYLAEFQSNPGSAFFEQAHIAFSYSYGVLMWALVFGSIGLFRRVLSQPRRWVRYVADASYWLYLVHLPIVVWLQVGFAELPLHWSLKLVSISLLTVGISLLTYDIAIRPTAIGRTLNGTSKASVLHSRFRRSRGAPASTVEGVCPPSRSVQSPPSAGAIG